MYLRCVYFISSVTPRPGLRRGPGLRLSAECATIRFIYFLLTTCNILRDRGTQIVQKWIVCLPNKSCLQTFNDVSVELLTITLFLDLSLFIFCPVESIKLYNSFKVDLYCDRLEGITGDILTPRRKGLRIVGFEFLEIDTYLEGKLKKLDLQSIGTRQRIRNSELIHPREILGSHNI